MLAVDDGIVSGNITAADLFFLLAVILGLIAAGLSFSTRPENHHRYSFVAGWLAVASIALGWFVL